MSEFGPVGDTSSVWECPDLFPVPVENNATEKKMGTHHEHGTKNAIFCW